MFKQLKFRLMPLIIASLLIFTDNIFAATLTYKNIISGKEAGTEYIITPIDNGYNVKVTNTFSNIVNIFDTDKSFYTVKWIYKDPDAATDIIAERSGKIILIKGILQNKEINKKIKIDKYPWTQDWFLGPKEFIKSSNDLFVYYMIDEKKLKEFKFECKKIKTEKVKLNGKDVEAVITNVRLGGIFKKFWDGGEMRFRKSDGTFIYSEKMDYSNPEDKVELYSEN